MNTRYIIYSKLLMAAQKNVLLTGAPGVGKTLVAREAARMPLEPITVSCREGLTYERLVAYYTIQDGNPILLPGDLFKAVVSSWLLIALGIGPRHLVIDEINRCNADLLLGEAFTAMDIPHRMHVYVLRGEAHKLASSILDSALQGEVEYLLAILELEDIPVDATNLQRAVEMLASRFRSLSGIPFPYSFRILATMNIYDRANLYSLGWAMQRRFATLYVLPPYENPEPSIDEKEIEKLEAHKNVARLLLDSSSDVYMQAVRELLATKMIEESMVELDNPTTPLEIEEDDVKDAIERVVKDYNHILKLIAYIYSVAERLRIELGISPLVDSAKLLLVYAISNLKTIGLNEVADLALSSLILPLLGAVVPRIRSELLIMDPESSYSFKVAKELYTTLRRVLGERTLSLKVVESFDLPYLTTS